MYIFFPFVKLSECHRPLTFPVCQHMSALSKAGYQVLVFASMYYTSINTVLLLNPEGLAVLLL